MATKYWYLKTGGTATTLTATATTNPTVQRTGAFSSMAAGDHFGTLADLLAGDDTYVPEGGDYVFVSDAHTESTGADWADVDGTPSWIVCVSVDDANCDTYKKATTPQFTLTGGNTCRNIKYYGMNFESGVNRIFTYTLTLDCLNVFSDCDIEMTGLGDCIYYDGGGAAQWKLLNCNYTNSAAATNTSFLENISGGSEMWIENCTLGGAGTWESVIDDITSPFTVYFTGCDLSPCSIFHNTGGDLLNDNYFEYRLDNCKMHPTVTWVNLTPYSYRSRIEAYNCTDATNLNPNQFHITSYSGTVDSEFDDSSGTDGNVVRSDGTIMSMETGSQYLSAKVVTNANCSTFFPIYFDMPVKWSALSNTDTGTMRFYVAGPSGLTDQDVVINTSYKDATTVSNINTMQTVQLDPLKSATTGLTSDAVSTWTNAGALTLYQIDLDTYANDPGLDQYPYVKVYVTKPSITLYIDTEYDLVA